MEPNRIPGGMFYHYPFVSSTNLSFHQPWNHSNVVRSKTITEPISMAPASTQQPSFQTQSLVHPASILQTPDLSATNINISDYQDQRTALSNEDTSQDDSGNTSDLSSTSISSPSPTSPDSSSSINCVPDQTHRKNYSNVDIGNLVHPFKSPHPSPASNLSSTPEQLNMNVSLDVRTDLNGSSHVSNKPVSPPTTTQKQPKKNNRTNYSPQQVKSLETIFIETPYPDLDMMEKISNDLSIPEKNIKIWFQNKRARSRKRAQNNHPTYPPQVYPCYPTNISHPMTPMMPPSALMSPFLAPNGSVNVDTNSTRTSETSSLHKPTNVALYPTQFPPFSPYAYPYMFSQCR